MMSFINNFIGFYHNAKKVNFIFLGFGLLYSLNIISQNYTNQEFIKIKNAPETAITLIKQDQIGHLWMATSKGIIQFDGTDFSLFNSENSLLTDQIHTFSIKKDSLFIGAKTHLSIKVRTNFHHFESKKINKIFFHNGITYTATDEGICFFNKNYLQPIQLNTQLDFAKINDIIFHQNSFYIASNNGFWKVDQLINPNKITRLNKEKYTILLLNETELIAVQNTNTITVFDRNKVTQNIKTISNITSVTKIENEIWITSTNESIEILDTKTYRFK
ncbi:hypothetical protein N9Q68_00980, partial [Polaribacter sp.]|nr:hypothetical protein [Polaribacter sp.]